MNHVAHLYQDPALLADAVAEYIGAGLARGEGAVVIATPEHCAAFVARLGAADRSRLRILDAEETLATFMVDGAPQWKAFHQVVGGLIAEMRLQVPTVRAYGEMVDVLWQRGEREAAIQLEECWNELGKLQTFSLFCAYRMDPAHSHLIPARDTARFDAAVSAASAKVLDPQLAQILLALAATHQTATQGLETMRTEALSERAGASPAG